MLRRLCERFVKSFMKINKIFDNIIIRIDIYICYINHETNLINM